MNLDTTLVVMKRNPLIPGGLEPATPGEVEQGLGVDAVQLRTVREEFGFGGKGLPPKHADKHRAINKTVPQRPVPEGQLGISAVELPAAYAQAFGAPATAPMIAPPATQCAPAPISYRAPATYGACRLQEKGLGAVALHRQVAGVGAALVIQANSPARPVLINRLVYGGTTGNNALLGQMDVNQDQLIHGGLVPALVFSRRAAHPIPFNLGLGTADVFTTSMRETIAALATGPLMLSGVNCFDSRFPYGPSTPGNWITLDYPCEPMGKDSRQIILGLGAAPLAVAEAAGAIATMAQAPATLMRMGALTLTSVMSQALPTAIPVLGRVPIQGADNKEFLEVTQVNVNGVEIFTSPSQVAATGGIPFSNFHPESNVRWYPDYIVSPADTINVLMQNNAPAAAGVNAAAANGAVVGCERIATC